MTKPICIICKYYDAEYEHFRNPNGHEFDICSDCMTTVQHQSNRRFDQ